MHEENRHGVDSLLKSLWICPNFVLLFARGPPVTFLKHLFKEVHQSIIEPKQAVAEQETQITTKVSK